MTSKTNEALLRTGACPGIRRGSAVNCRDVLVFKVKCQAPVAEVGRWTK